MHSKNSSAPFEYETLRQTVHRPASHAKQHAIERKNMEFELTGSMMPLRRW